MGVYDEQAKDGELAEALGLLAVEEGAGAAIWARVIADQLANHVESRDQFIAKKARQSTFERFYGTAYVIVLATDQILRLETRVRKLTGDAELPKARKAFHDRAGYSAKDIRDLAVHLDEYVIGQGHRQTGRGNSENAVTRRVQTSLIWTDLGESYFSIGSDQLSVDRTAQAAMVLAEAVERVRAKHQRKAIKRFGAAVEAEGLRLRIDPTNPTLRRSPSS